MFLYISHWPALSFKKLWLLQNKKKKVLLEDVLVEQLLWRLLVSIVGGQFESLEGRAIVCLLRIKKQIRKLIIKKFNHIEWWICILWKMLHLLKETIYFIYWFKKTLLHGMLIACVIFKNINHRVEFKLKTMYMNFYICIYKHFHFPSSF